MLNYTGQKNPIYPGAPWTTILKLNAKTAWAVADETPANWRLRIHPTREGGDASILAQPAVVARDAADTTVLDMRVEVTGEQTATLANTAGASVELEHLQNGEWKPTPGMAGRANVMHLPGAPT